VDVYTRDLDVKLPRTRPWWRRWLRRVLIGILTFAVVEGARRAYNHHIVTARLQEALAELDRTDPGWRLKDIEAARAPVPDAENGARSVVAAAQHLPKDWPSREFGEAFSHLEPPEQLAPDKFALLCRGLKVVDAALKEARELAVRPAGRHRIHYPRNVINALLDDQLEVRRVTRLLVYEAMRQDHVGDKKGALTSCRAALNAARSIGDEPLPLSQLVRMGCVRETCEAVERTLAQSEPEADDLERLQRALEEEDRFPGLLIATRGERASIHELFDALESGDLRLSQFTGNEQTPSTREEWVFGWIIRDNIRADHSHYLSLMAQRIKDVQLPTHEQADAERRFVIDVPDLPRKAVLSRLLLKAVEMLGDPSRRKQAHVRCAAAALAAERYRCKHGAWPKSLEELVVSKMLSAVPLDPYDGEPLRFVRLPDGILIYSVSTDGKDDGGAINRENPTLPGSDLGFRLWDVKHRRQPPRAAPKIEHPAEPE
jgi:hypothetical protein